MAAPRLSWGASICDAAAPASWSDWGLGELAEVGVSPLRDEFRDGAFFASNVALMAATLYGWEYAVTLPSEVQLYIRAHTAAPELMMFVLVRYSTLAAVVLGGYSVWDQGSNGCIPHSQVPTMLVQLAVCSVFAWRAVAIWKYDVRIIVLVGLLLVTLLVFSGLITMTLRQARLPTGTCILHQSDNADSFFTVAWFYAGSLLYDASLMVISVYGLVRKCSATRTQRWHKRIRSHIKQHSTDLLFFSISCAFNAACFAMGITNESRARALLVLYTAVMCSVCQHILLAAARSGSTWRRNATRAEQPDKSTKLVLSTFLKSSAMAPSASTDSAVLPMRAPTPQVEDKCCTVLQLHDFQQSEPAVLLRPPTCCPVWPKADEAEDDEPIEYLEVCDSSGETSELEVADILANMSDDAKSVALALAGMEDHPPADRIYEPRYQRSSRRRRPPTQWLMHPPLM